MRKGRVTIVHSVGGTEMNLNEVPSGAATLSSSKSKDLVKVSCQIG